jgi:hypothetical protein
VLVALEEAAGKKLSSVSVGPAMKGESSLITLGLVRPAAGRWRPPYLHPGRQGRRRRRPGQEDREVSRFRADPAVGRDKRAGSFYTGQSTDGTRSRPTAGRAGGGNAFVGGSSVSIVRVGLAETKNFGEGYEAIFGKKKEEAPAKKSQTARKSAVAKKKKAGKKK